jgi:hypothetical protein
MVKCGVLFEVRTEFLNKGLKQHFAIYIQTLRKLAIDVARYHMKSKHYTAKVIKSVARTSY